MYCTSCFRIFEEHGRELDGGMFDVVLLRCALNHVHFFSLHVEYYLHTWVLCNHALVDASR
jgi:hypothetical protein